MLPFHLFFFVVVVVGLLELELKLFPSPLPFFRSEGVHLLPLKGTGLGSDEELEKEPLDKRPSFDTIRAPKVLEDDEEEERTNFVVRVDDETDEDLMSLLLDPHISQNKFFTFNSTNFLNRALPRELDSSLCLFNLQELTLLKVCDPKIFLFSSSCFRANDHHIRCSLFAIEMAH